MRFLLTRHPQCEYNVEERFQGVLDSPVTELGKLQLGALVLCLKDSDLGLKQVVASPLVNRLCASATTLAEALKIPFVPNEYFGEVNYGLWEGKNKYSCEDSYPELYGLYKNNPLSSQIAFPEGEKISDVFTRVNLGLKSTGIFQDTLIVGSNLFLQVLYVTLTGMDPPQRFPQCSITVLEDRPGSSLFDPVKIADESHLRGLSLR